jgi:hypothetical protein
MWSFKKEFPVHILELDINTNPEMFGRTYRKYIEMGYAHIFLPYLKLHIQNISFYIKTNSSPGNAIYIMPLSKKRYSEEIQASTRIESIYHEDMDLWEPIVLMLEAYLLRERLNVDNGYIKGKRKNWCKDVVIKLLGKKKESEED